MQLAAWNVEPIDGRLNDSCSGSSKGNEKLNVEREPFFSEPASNSLVASSSNQLEATLRIVHRDTGCNGNKRREYASSNMPAPGSLDSAAQDLAAGAKVSIRCISALEIA
jgi:hypothetical protein